MRVPVLTYHSNNIQGIEYSQNDHVALAADLAYLKAQGIRVISLRELIRQFLLEPCRRLDQPTVAITFDDGSWFDWYDLEHPLFGVQQAFASLLRASGGGVSATSFVIASPEARAQLDSTCLIGKGWWTDCWWRAASESGVIEIENHSWDHNHETLSEPSVCVPPTGRFDHISTRSGADAEIQQARLYIDRICAPKKSSLFAYPYGHVSPFLSREYFPHLQSEVIAAFTTSPEPIGRGCNRWELGRYVCGHHWKSVEDLRRLLEDAFRISIAVSDALVTPARDGAQAGTDSSVH